MSNVQPLRVGVVGTGFAGEVHIKSFKNIPSVTVVGVADPRPERLEQLKELYNLEAVYEDYNNLVNRDDIDIISIGTPNFLHAPVAIAALNSGKHVLTEKPIARNYSEAVQMVEAAEKNGRVLKVIFNQRRFNDVETVKSYVDEGHLGRIYHAKASWMRRMGVPGFGGWFTTKEQSGGGPLIDLGIHVLDMALHLMGEPVPIAVSGATYAEHGPRGRGSRRGRPVVSNSYDVEDLATAFIRFEGGETLLLEASWEVYGSKGDDFGVILYGTEGGAEIDIQRYKRDDSVKLFTDVNGVPATITPNVRGGDGPQAVITEFAEIIRSGEWDGYQGREGLVRAQIIEAIYKSSIEGREIILAEL